MQAITYNESREEPSWILLSEQIRIRHPGNDKWPQLQWHPEVMRCFSFCSGLYAIYDVITVPSEGIFSFEGATLSSFPQFILYVVSFLDCKSE